MNLQGSADTATIAYPSTTAGGSPHLVILNVCIHVFIYIRIFKCVCIYIYIDTRMFIHDLKTISNYINVYKYVVLQIRPKHIDHQTCFIVNSSLPKSLQLVLRLSTVLIRFPRFPCRERERRRLSTRKTLGEGDGTPLGVTW